MRARTARTHTDSISRQHDVTGCQERSRFPQGRPDEPPLAKGGGGAPLTQARTHRPWRRTGGPAGQPADRWSRSRAGDSSGEDMVQFSAQSALRLNWPLAAVEISPPGGEWTPGSGARLWSQARGRCRRDYCRDSHHQPSLGVATLVPRPAVTDPSLFPRRERKKESVLLRSQRSQLIFARIEWQAVVVSGLEGMQYRVPRTRPCPRPAPAGALCK